MPEILKSHKLDEHRAEAHQKFGRKITAEIDGSYEETEQKLDADTLKKIAETFDSEYREGYENAKPDGEFLKIIQEIEGALKFISMHMESLRREMELKNQEREAREVSYYREKLGHNIAKAEKFLAVDKHLLSYTNQVAVAKKIYEMLGRAA